MMFLKQLSDEIHFGTDDQRHVLTTARIGHFTRETVAHAESQLIAAYPDDADEITRLAGRLRQMV